MRHRGLHLRRDHQKSATRTLQDAAESFSAPRVCNTRAERGRGDRSRYAARTATTSTCTASLKLDSDPLDGQAAREVVLKPIDRDVAACAMKLLPREGRHQSGGS